MNTRSVHRHLLVVALSASAAVSFAGRLAAQDRRIGGAGITVYRDENFRGEIATFRQDVPDLRRFNFSDRITSLRVAPGEYWEGCELANYQGRCQVFSGEERDLRRVGWTDRISSLRRVRGGGGGGGGYPGPRPPDTRGGIVLYDDPYFRGKSLPMRGPTENLRFQSFHDRAESVRVLSGRWELCAEPNFRRCQIVDRDVPTLSSLGLNKKLSSIRPVGFVPGPGGGGGGGYPGPRPPDTRGGIVLYDDPYFRGNSLPMRGTSENLRFQRFHDRAESVRVLSGRWELCAEPNFRRCQIVDRDVPTLSSLGLNKKLSSIRPVGFVPGPGGGGSYPPPYPEGARLVLFENPGYRGRSVTLDAATAIVSGSGNRARSAQVLGGTWQLCDGPRFSGRCRQVNSSVPNLDSWGFNGPIRSARPVRGY